MSISSAKTQRALQKETTRARILAQATRLCARRGFAGTRTIDVARAARVSHGALFVHFPSRDALVGEVIREIAREVTDELHRLATADASLRDVLAAHLACIAEREEQLRWLLLEGPSLPAGFRTAWIGFQSAVSHHVTRAAMRESASGAIRELAPHLLFNTWIGLVHHYLMNRELFAPGRSVVRTHGSMLLEHFLELIRTQKGR